MSKSIQITDVGFVLPISDTACGAAAARPETQLWKMRISLADGDPQNADETGDIMGYLYWIP